MLSNHTVPLTGFCAKNLANSQTLRMKSRLSVHPPHCSSFQRIRTTPAPSNMPLPVVSPFFSRMSSMLTLMVTTTPTSASQRAWAHSQTLPNASLGDKKLGAWGKPCQGALCKLQMTPVEEVPDQIFPRGHAAQTVWFLDGSGGHKPVVWYQEIKVDIFFFCGRLLRATFFPSSQMLSKYLFIFKVLLRRHVL